MKINLQNRKRKELADHRGGAEPPLIQFKQLDCLRTHQLAVYVFRSNQPKTAFLCVKFVQRAYSEG